MHSPMCRYETGCGYDRYKKHYVCFSCRKMFRSFDRKTPSSLKSCPQCAGGVYSVGKDLKIPRRQNLKEWKKIEYLYKVEGKRFGSCGCDGPGYIAPTLAWHLRENKPKEEIWRK